jgi:uncharacterized protein
MSQSDIETIRLVYEAISRGDWDAALDEASANFELIPPDSNPIAGTYRGPEQVRGFFDELWAAFDEVEVRPQEFLDLGDRILVFLQMRFKPAESNASLEMRLAHVWTVHDGEIIRCEVFTERHQALEAVGLSEQDAHAGSS